MSNVFANSADLTAAVVARAKGYEVAVVVPTIKEQLTELIQPGRAVAFRTENGSLYEMSIYTDMRVVLSRIDEESDGIRQVATGELIGAHDRKRGVVGIVINEPGGRVYKTSAVTKVWLSYDATVGDTGVSHREPA